MGNKKIIFIIPLIVISAIILGVVINGGREKQVTIDLSEVDKVTYGETMVIKDQDMIKDIVSIINSSKQKKTQAIPFYGNYIKITMSHNMVITLLCPDNKELKGEFDEEIFMFVYQLDDDGLVFREVIFRNKDLAYMLMELNYYEASSFRAINEQLIQEIYGVIKANKHEELLFTKQ